MAQVFKLCRHSPESLCHAINFYVMGISFILHAFFADERDDAWVKELHMDTCVVDIVPEHCTPPNPEAIRQTREKQMAALREMRRWLTKAGVSSMRTPVAR